MSCIQNSTFSPFQHSIEPPHLSFFVASLAREPLCCCFCRRTVWRTSCSKSPQNWTCKLNPSLGCDACFLAFVQRLYVLIYWYICRAVIGIGGAVKTKCRFDSFKRPPRQNNIDSIFNIVFSNKLYNEENREKACDLSATFWHWTYDILRAACCDWLSPTKSTAN